MKLLKWLMLQIASYVAAFAERYQLCYVVSQNYPTIADFEKALVVKYGAIEVVYLPQYDYLLYPTAGAQNLQFFQFQQGTGLSSSPGNANATKAITDTSLVGSGGQFPAPQAFWADTIEVSFEPGSVSTANTYTIQNPGNIGAAGAAAVQAGENDVSNVLNSGSLNFVVGTKSYYQEGPLYRFPTRPQVRMDVALASNSATANEVLKGHMSNYGDVCTMDPGVGIMTSMNFNVTLAWPALVPTTSGFNGRIGVILGGFLYRAVQ